jgi:hypothetical protein
MINILPIDDWIDHEENTTCICNPEIEFCEGELIIKHNAADGRE